MPALPPIPSRLAGLVGRPVVLEGRAPWEMAHLRLRPVPLGAVEGRRVVIVTGYLAGAASAAPMADWLRTAGYVVDIAPVGRNANTSSFAVERIEQALDRRDGSAVVIGHSRGGQQARVAAYRRPERVERLITLAAPVRALLPRQAWLRASVEAIRLTRFTPFGPEVDVDAEAAYERDLFAPFEVDVPWTTVWSRADGVVEWQTCVDAAADSVEITCSHTGMIAAAASFRAIAEVLDRG